jgi:hypothetical protein
MTANPQRPQEAEVEELARLLPAPGGPELTTDRRQALKDHLMREINQPTAPARATASRGRRRWTLVAVPMAAAAAAAAVVAGTAGHSSTQQAQGHSAPSVVTVEAASSQGVATFANQVADVAAHGPATTVRADQYEYIKSIVAFSRQVQQKTMDGKTVLDAVHERQVWLPQDPSKAGLIRENGKDTRLGGGGYTSVDGAPAKPAGAGNTTYAQLAALPTDPDALLKKIYADTKGHGTNRDAEAFAWIGDQLGEAIAPPKLTAAMLRAAAEIPGVVVVHKAVDAAGRHGEAIARTSDGERTEWIFDKSSRNYLGERSYLVKDTGAGKAGTLTGSSAVLGRAVVDKLAQLPTRSA